MLLTTKILDETSAKAKTSPRLRMNWNLHESFDDSVQRMFNALEPGTEVPIARHPDSAESLIILRGRLRILIFNDNKDIIEDVVIDPRTDNIGYHVPKGIWHQVQSLEEGTILFETREGPYAPVAECDILK